MNTAVVDYSAFAKDFVAVLVMEGVIPESEAEGTWDDILIAIDRAASGRQF